ncbi:MAG: sulfatase-like hydrolase/transferase [Candidatus Aminicenantales bacterium]
MKIIRGERFSLLYLLFLLAFFLVFFLGEACAKKEVKVLRHKGLNVMLITIDTLRADRVGYSGYSIQTPNLDSLAYGGARFMNAFCQVPLTLPSHASILTGTNPPFHRIKNNGTYYLKAEFTTLAEVLKQAGYQTAAFVGAFPLDSQFGLNQGFDFYDDRFENPDYLKGYEPQRTAQQVYKAAASWFDRHEEEPFFVWIHFYDPHLPYTPPPPFDSEYSSPYDGEVAYTDVYLGKLIELLKRKGLFSTTLLVVVGDHGEGLGDHGEDTHGIFLYDTTLRVPLIFHCPGKIPGRIELESVVRTVDIFPTVLDLLTIPVPEFCQGKNLVPLIEGKRAEFDSYAETYLPFLACGWSELKAIRTNRWKFIKAPRSELYDLEKDPLEEKNVIDREKDVALELEEKLSWREKALASAGIEEPERKLSPEEREKLLSLGYAEGGRVGSRPRHSLTDPKDKIQVFERALRAELMVSRGEAKGAREVLKSVIEQDPENPLLYHFLGRAYQKLGEWESSIIAFSQALELNPEDVYSHYSLAASYFKTGEKEKARKEAETVLSFFKNHLQSLLLLAEIHGSSGKYSQAADYLKRAVEVQPSNVELAFLYADYLTLAGKYTKAGEKYRSLIEKVPEDPRPYHGLGVVSYFKGEFQEAVRSFTREIELGGGGEAYFLLGMSYGKLGKYQEAVRYLTFYVENLPPEEKEKREKVMHTIAYYKSRM